MIFIETNAFTKLLPDYLSDEEYRALQTYLMQKSDAGDIVKGSGGVRKVRWAPDGRGKVAVFELSTIGRNLTMKSGCLLFIANRSDLRFLVIF